MDFIEIFNKKVEEKNIDWNVCGLISPNKTVYSLGSDSKLIGRIFELISYSILQEIAEENGYTLVPSNQQTVYPDFTMMKGDNDSKKIAIDIKTTYRSFSRNGEMKKIGFTLGSYASFMRNNKKNIMYPYDEYDKHYIIGFVYSRNEKADEGKVYSIGDLDSLEVPYSDVKVFVQEKYKIAGEKPGSGNTENIGSFKTNNMDFLINGEGPFASLGNVIFERYWSNYPQYRANEKNYTNIDEYLEWEYKRDNGYEFARLKRIYDSWKKQHD